MSGNTTLLTGRTVDAVEAHEKGTLGNRLRAVRTDIFGLDGIEKLAQSLGIAPQVWRNVELIGELISPNVWCAFIELTGASPAWLLRGEGARYRDHCQWHRPSV